MCISKGQYCLGWRQLPTHISYYVQQNQRCCQKTANPQFEYQQHAVSVHTWA